LLVTGFIGDAHLPQALHFDVGFLPFWTILIFVFAHERGIISKLLGRRPFVFLGEISFSFYMLHQLVIRYIWHYGIKPVAPIAFTITLVGSAALFLLYEENMRKLVRNKLEAKLVWPRKNKDTVLAEEAF
jgi:peptidoglycan/LPS O-acetylase OafA/YrhL